MNARSRLVAVLVLRNGPGALPAPEEAIGSGLGGTNWEAVQ